ncbi:hypothetical protein F2Q69_00004159 [Brassica cretica]|uniref:Uncharacterized protein n=1 Tax=Brassica cretica TaxID=69181 RepID=A0A8S9NUM2_BRACR|nr:hypothetical protein F2Q69_00004159 [Brassica cretica]
MSPSRAEPPPIRTSTPEPAICRKGSEWPWISKKEDEGKKNERLWRRLSRSRARRSQSKVESDEQRPLGMSREWLS